MELLVAHGYLVPANQDWWNEIVSMRHVRASHIETSPTNWGYVNNLLFQDILNNPSTFYKLIEPNTEVLKKMTRGKHRNLFHNLHAELDQQNLHADYISLNVQRAKINSLTCQLPSSGNV